MLIDRLDFVSITAEIMAMEANIMLIKCGKAKKVFGARIQKTDSNDWIRTWAFKISYKEAMNERYDITPIQGSLAATRECSGCPYCRTNVFLMWKMWKNKLLQ